MGIPIIQLRNPGAADGILVRMDGYLVDFFRESDEQPLALRSRQVWKDERFPLTRDKQGQSAKPDYDFTDMGLLFPQDDDTETEIIYITHQLSHGWVLGSSITPHVHYVQDEAEEPVFKLAYRWYENGGDPTGSFTVISASTFMYTYTSGSILQRALFPDIDGSAVNSLSSMLDMKLYRDDNVVSGDVLTKEFDLHCLFNTMGSVGAYSKLGG